MKTQTLSYREREDKLFEKIKSRQLRRSYNNRNSKIEAKERYWLITFTLPYDYTFKENQEKWYVKCWLWDSYKHVIKREDVLKVSLDSKTVLWKTLYAVKILADKELVFFSGDSNKILVADFKGSDLRIINYGYAAHKMSIHFFGAACLLISYHEKLGTKAIFSDALFRSSSDVFVHHDFHHYVDGSVNLFRFMGGIVITIFNGISWKIDFYAYGVSGSYGGSRKENYVIESKECDILFEGKQKDLVMVIDSPKTTIRTKLFYKED